MSVHICFELTLFCVNSRTLLRYFFPPDFRIPKDSVNTMSAEDLVAFPIVSTFLLLCGSEFCI